jgi:hypothetical protein
METPHHQCRVCDETKPETEFFKATKPGHIDKICKPCKAARLKKRRLAIKNWCVEYKGGKCIICGYSKCKAAMDFHHLDPTQKDFGIGERGNLPNKENLKAELDKCVLLCRNCHAEVHAGILQLQ